MNPRSEFSVARETLEYLYNVEHLSAEKIADRLRYGVTTVRRWLRKYGIPLRTKHDYRLEIPREELDRLYNEQGLTLDEIGQLFGCSGRTIGRRLREFGISARPVGPVSGCMVPSEVFATWSPELAYAVGLITSDGNLCKDRYRVEFISTELELIQLYCSALHLPDDIHVGVTSQESRKSWHRIRLSDRHFYAFLEHVGLTPVKSKTLGPLQIPDEVFPDFLRGCLDGDGTWYVKKEWGGRYQYLRAELCSASLRFLEWCRDTVTPLTGLQGSICVASSHRAYNLVYNGREAIALGRWIYYSPSVLALTRKRAVWARMADE